MMSLTLSGLIIDAGWGRLATPVKILDAAAQPSLSLGVEGDVSSETLLASGQSWNSNVSCTPVITTFEQIMGTPLNRNQGGLLSSSPWATHEFGYVDSNGNNAYDPGEPVVYDENRDGVVDVVPGTNDPTYAAGGNGGDRLLNGVNSTLVSGSLLGQALKQDAKLRYIDGSSTTAYYNTTNGSWDAGGKGEHGETVVYDANDNKIVDSNDIVVSGGPRAPSSAELGKPLQTVVFGGTFNKRATNPPCTVTNAQGQTISNFVEIHGVYPLADSPSWVYETADCNTTYNGINGGGAFPNSQKLCDSTGNWQTFGFRGSCSPADRTACSHRLHFEIDRDWFAKGYCSQSSTVCNNSTLTRYVALGASGGSLSFDIQGFVYWDPTEYNKTAHSFSGWEIHPFTAWRLSPPNGSFTFTPTNPMVGDVVNFTATGSNGVAPYSFGWNFGDGSTGTGRSVLHTYATKGTFTATVSLTDSETPPQTARLSKTITVNPVALTVAFTVTPSSPTIGQSVRFTGIVSGGSSPYTFSWNFGDGSIDEGSTVSHTYTSSGRYVANMTVVDAEGRSVASSKTVEVSSQPPAPFWQQYWYLLATAVAGGALSTILILRNRPKVLKNNSYPQSQLLD